MRAAVTQRPGLIEFCEVPEPVRGPGEALVRVETVGICGSDKHLYRGTHPYSNFPLVQGHELSARVEQLPDGYDGELRVGGRVAIEPLLTCGTCYACIHGQRGCCLNMRVYGAHMPGGFQELLAVPTSHLHATTLPADLAALVEPMSIGVHATARALIVQEDEVLVFGAGPIGLSILFAAQEVGARVLLVDLLQRRLELAKSLAADVLLWTDVDSTVTAARAWCRRGAPTVAMDATGLPEAIEAAVCAVIAGGRVVVVGQTKQSVTLPVSAFTSKELNFLGSQNTSGEFARTLEMVERRSDFVARLISRHFTFDEVHEAIEFADMNPDSTVKVLVDMLAPSR